MQFLIERFEDDKDFPCFYCPMEDCCFNENTDKRIECQAVGRFLQSKEDVK
jgi:hypothetical protein